MNPHMNIKAWTVKVEPATEDMLDDEFWTNLDGVTNALDNVQARLYVDSRCIFYKCVKLIFRPRSALINASVL